MNDFMLLWTRNVVEMLNSTHQQRLTETVFVVELNVLQIKNCFR